MISQIQAAVSAVISNKTAVSAAGGHGEHAAVDKTLHAPADKASFSTLARQLNESAARAAARDAEMSHAQLGKYGRDCIREFTQETSEANSGTRAMEVPKTQDPELLDRARAASAFVTRTLAGDKNARSPFENLSREQLNLIAYDDGGSFTLNERRAAWQGVQKMDEAWRKTALAQGNIEQIRTGKASKFYNEALNYFKSLPTIEKAVNYPKNAEAILESRIKGDKTLPSFPGLMRREGGDRKLTLYDVLAGIVDTQKDNIDPANPARTKKFTLRTSLFPTTTPQPFVKEDAPNAKIKSVSQVAMLTTAGASQMRRRESD